MLTAIHERRHLLEPWLLQFERVLDKYNVKFVIVESSRFPYADDVLRGLSDDFSRRTEIVNVPQSHFWARGITRAMDEFSSFGDLSDRVVLCNDDVRFTVDAFESLVDFDVPNSAVSGVSTRDNVYTLRLNWDKNRHRLTGIVPCPGKAHLATTDFLSGRFVALDGGVLMGGIRPRWRTLPHHYADFDFFNRLKQGGSKLYVNFRAEYTDTESPSLLSNDTTGFFDRHFSRPSPNRLISRCAFYFPLIVRTLKNRSISGLD